MNRKLVEKKWKTDVAVEVKSEVKELRKQVHDLQQQLYAACDSDAEARRRCQQLVTAKYYNQSDSI